MNNPSSEPQIPEPPKVTRRAIISGLAGLVGVAAVGSTLAAGEKEHKPDEKHPPEEAPEHKETLPEWLDWSTAGAVVGAFGYHVLWKGAKKGENLGWDSVADVNGAAGARILALRLLGGEEGEHLAYEEAHEIAGGLLPVPILLALSDATTTQLKIDAEAIFKKVEETMEHTQSYRDIQRPSLGESIEVWQSHLEKVNKDIVDKTAQITAICSVFAPLGTTYTSSALANTLKKEVLHMLYEQSYALEIIQEERLHAYRKAIENTHHTVPKGEDQNLEVIVKTEVHQKAAERADKLFNGPGGFSNLMVTLSSNIQGTWALGDPPEIYYAINHARKSPLRLAKAEGVGIANAQIFTVGLTGWWLKKAGVMSKDYIKGYTSGLGKSLKSIAELVDGDLRSVSFNEGAKFTEKLEKALREQKGAKEQQAKELLAVLESIPKAKLQFPIKKYLFDKWRALQQGLHRIPDLGSSDAIFETLDAFVEDPFIDKLHQQYEEKIKASGGKDSIEILAGLEGQLMEAGRKIQNAKAERLAELLEGFTVEAPSVLDHEAVAKMRAAAKERNEEPLDPEIAQKTDHILNLLDGVHGELDGYSEKARMKKIKEALEKIPQNVTVESKKDIFTGLNIPDRQTIQDALGKLTALKEDEPDAIEGFENIGKVGDAIEAVRKKAHAEHQLSFLSHSAKEVFFALLTQIPSVPALARVFGKLIPMMVGVKKGEKPTPAQLKTIISITLTLEALLSGFADNVAAYMFGEKLLSDFFTLTYGTTLLEENPSVMDNISIAALKVAENAGSLSKIGNGPNFSHKAMKILASEKVNQGIEIDEQEIQLGDTMLWKNHFASAANVASIAMYSAYVMKAMPHRPENENALNNKAQQVPFNVAA